jgi:hypothetical protein
MIERLNKQYQNNLHDDMNDWAQESNKMELQLDCYKGFRTWGLHGINRTQTGT